MRARVALSACFSERDGSLRHPMVVIVGDDAGADGEPRVGGARPILPDKFGLEAPRRRDRE